MKNRSRYHDRYMILYCACFLFHLVQSVRLNVNEVYSLRRGTQLSDFDYIVGPSHLRKLTEKAYRKLNHDLEDARARHRVLDKQLKSIENHPLADVIQTEYQEIKRLKHEKLKCKDQIVQFMRKQKKELQQGLSDPSSVIELGSGGFGKVMFGECVNSKKDVAIKISSKNDYKALAQEYEILKSLPEFGFPKVFHFGQQVVLDGREHAVMVMDVLGPSLEKVLFSTYLGVRGFKEQTVLRLAQQIVGRLKVLADHYIVHGDIQPGNFLLGKDIHTNRTVFLIDFGLSSIVSGADSSRSQVLTSVGSDSSSMQFSQLDKPQQQVNTFKSTARYGTLQFASASTLEGSLPMFRDDLESCIYTLSYLLLGHLPWTHQDMALYTLDHDSNLIASNPSEYLSRRQAIVNSVIQMKRNIKLSDLCESFADTGMGEVINCLLLQSKRLRGAELPDYTSVLRIIDKSLLHGTKVGKPDELQFDWEAAGVLWSHTDGTIQS